MKGLNVRLLATLVGVGLVLAIVIGTLHHVQVRRHAKFYLEKAKKLNQSKDLKERAKAIEFYGRYLGLFPKQTEARAELGLLYADLAETQGEFFSKALAFLETVLREDSLRDDVRRRVVDLAVEAGRYNDAREHIEILQERLPKDSKLPELLARCQIAEKDYVGARKSYEKAISLAPDSLEAYVGLADLIQAHPEEVKTAPPVSTYDAVKKDAAPKDGEKEKAPEGGAAKEATAKSEAPKDSAVKTAAAKEEAAEEDNADYWINKMVERNPKTAKAYLLRAQYYRKTRRLDEARKDAEAALKLAPDDEDTLLTVVNLAQDESDFELARKHAQHAIELFPDSPRAYQALINLELRAGRPKQAREWIEKGLTATGEDPSLIWEKAVLLISEGDLEPVRPLIERLSNSMSMYRHPVLISFLEGRLAFAQKEWAKARTFFEQIRTEMERFSPSMARQANLNLAECYDKLNRRELALSVLRDLQEKARGGTVAGTDAWRQLASQGQFPQAIAKLRQLLKRPGASPELWVELAKLLVYYSERVPESNRDWTEAEDAVNKVAELLPDHAELHILQARILLGQQRAAEARELLEKAVKHTPTRWELWDPLVMLAQADKDYDRAAKLLDEAERHVVAKTSIYLARARLAVARDEEKASAELKQLGEKAEGMADSEKLFFWRMMAGFCLKAKDFELAKTFCKNAADKDPTDLRIRVLLFEVARQVQDLATMKQTVDEIDKIEQRGPLWHYYSAQWLVLSSEKEDKDKDKDKTRVYKQALGHLNQARLGRPEWADVPMLMAKIQQQMGDRQAAVESYLAAVELGSRDVLGISNAADLLLEEGRHEEANQMLRILEQLKAPLPTGALFRRGAQRLLDGDIEGGTADFKQVADDFRKRTENSKDYRPFQGLSRVLRTLAQIAKRQNRDAEANEHFDEAEKTLRQATQIAPENTELWIERVVLLSEAGRIREVSDVLNEAKKKLPPDEVAMTLGKCYQVLGRLTEAETEFEKAASQSKKNKELARLMARLLLQSDDKEKQKKGEVILREMIDGTRPCDEKEDIPWARRQLVVLLSQRGDYRSYQEATELVGANLEKDPESVLDKRLKARLLARRPSRTERKQAQAIFEELARLPKPSPDDCYELARLYFAEEQWNRASQQMQPLLASKNIRPEWLDFQIRAQIRAGEFAGIDAKIDRYATMVNNPFAIAVMRARVFAGRKQHDEAIRVLREYVDDTSSVLATRPTRARQVAQAFENLAKHVFGPGSDEAVEQYLKQAEVYLREFVQQDPASTMLLVSFLGRHGRREEALRIAEEAWKQDQPDAIAVSAVGLLVQGDPTPDEIQRVEKILSGAIEKRGEEIPLLLAMAELRSIEKRYEDTEKVYRDVLAKEPDNIIALNNLAVFLSLRGLKLDESMQLVNRAIELAGPVATLLDSRASVYLALGKWQQSLDDLSMALAEEPTGIRFFHQAQAYALGGKKKEALAAMKMADGYGLKVEHLQPLERAGYRQIKEDLK